MKVLILGGTQFVGRTIVEHLLSHKPEWKLTLCNRGKSAPEVFAQLPLIVADREEGDMSAVSSQTWDVVIDVSSYYPDSLRDFLKSLKAGRYVYISTASVYRMGEDKPPYSEQMPTVECPDEMRGNEEMLSYGMRKRACELELLEAAHLNPVILRPSIIYGPYDPYDRHYYWLWRFHLNESLLVPESPAGFGNYTWVEDLAKMVAYAAENDLPESVYNTATHDPLSVEEICAIMKKVVGSDAQTVTLTADKLKELEIKPAADMPLWYENARLHLSTEWAFRDFPDFFTDLESTFSAWTTWHNEHSWHVPQRWMDREREQQILASL